MLFYNITLLIANMFYCVGQISKEALKRREEIKVDSNTGTIVI